MDVSAWLEDLQLAAYAEAFAENGVDFALLAELSNDDLKDLGVARLADRKRLLAAIQALAPPHDTDGPIAAAAVTPAGDHRQVTVLFADIAGFTRLTSELGAENIHTLLNQYFEAVDAIVLSYGGSVDKHIGDNVMAVFGAPIAHDDDPLRAVRAAFDIHQRVRCLSDLRGRPLQAHIGIASGQVVASGTGSDSHRQYTVTGDSVNLAARLQDHAAAGETLISHALWRSVSDRVDCHDLGEVDVKGIERPVRVWKAEAMRVGATPSARVAFVGREAELAQLAGVAEACQAGGSGRAIVIRGQAGIGKTRLVEEFSRIAAAKRFKVQKGLVLNFGVGEGRDAVRTVVHSLLDLTPGGETAARQAAVAATISKGLLAPELRIFLHDLLDLPQSAEDQAIYDAMTNTVRNEGKRTAVANILRGLSAEQPLAVIIEDIHWADPLSLAHLATMAATFADCPGLLVMTSRIEGYPLDEAWRGKTGGCPLMTLDLAPLRSEESIKLAATFLDTSQQIALNCVERAQGNPLFLEQLLRNAEEYGDGDVPASIQSLVLARIDRLPPADKQAAQAASVLGQRFALDALQHLIGNPGYSCREFIQRSLVRSEGDDYLFDHALVQEAVYGSLLKSRRDELHRTAAAFYGERAPVMRAQHLDRADDRAAADAYLEAAVAQAASLHFETALSLADRGIEVAHGPAISFDLMRLRGDVLRNTGATEESIAAFDAALSIASDSRRRCLAQIGLAEGLRIADRPTRALDVLDDAEAAAVQEGLAHERLRIHYLRGNVYFPLGNIDGCLAEHEQALEFARRVKSSEGEALALGGLGDAHYLRGHMRSACEQFRACIAVCRAQGYRHIEVANRHMIGWSRVHFMEFSGALEDGLEAAKLASKVSDQRAELLGMKLAGLVCLELGRFAEADAHARRALELALTIGASNFAAQALRLLAQNSAALGRQAEALENAERAVAIVREVGMTFIGPSVLATRAALAEDPRQALATFAEGEAILDAGCVAHNHFWFAQTAIEHAVSAGAWDRAEHYAARLEDYTRGQPLAWPDFMIARARALAAFGRGVRSRELVVELKLLRERAVRHGLVRTIPQLDNALAAA